MSLSSSGGGCTGVLISPFAILTAGHCDMNGGLYVSYRLGSAPVDWKYFGADEYSFKRPPSYSDSPYDNDRDLAVLHPLGISDGGERRLEHPDRQSGLSGKLRAHENAPSSSGMRCQGVLSIGYHPGCRRHRPGLARTKVRVDLDLQPAFSKIFLRP